MSENTSPAIASVGWLILKVVAGEFVFFTIGLMFLPPPPVLVGGSLFAAWLLIGSHLGPERDRLARVFRRVFPDDPFIGNARIPQWFVATVVIALLLPFWGWAEWKLWMSGNFGEPPHNRYVRFWSYKTPADPGIYRMLTEFGVRYASVAGVNVAVGVTPNQQSIFQRAHWLTAPGVFRELPKEERLTSLASGHYSSPLESEVQSIRGEQHSIRPDQSFYMLLLAHKPFRFSGCYFRPFFDESGGDCSEPGSVSVERVRGSVFVDPLPKPKPPD